MANVKVHAGNNQPASKEVHTVSSNSVTFRGLIEIRAETDRKKEQYPVPFQTNFLAADSTIAGGGG
jgi:hypothetical protein